MVSIDVVEAMLKRLQDDSDAKLEKFMSTAATAATAAATAATQAQTELIQKLMEKPSGGGGNGGSGGTRKEPPVFKGDEKKYAEWMVKLIAFYKSNNAKTERWIQIAMNSKEVQEDGVYGSGDEWLGHAEDLVEIKKFSTNLYSALLGYTEDDAFKLVQSASECQGLEALRLLKRRYDPKSPGTKRALLKSIMGIPPAKKLVEIETSIMRLEEMIKKYESMTGQKHAVLPPDLVVTMMIDVCTKDLREHLELTIKNGK